MASKSAKAPKPSTTTTVVKPTKKTTAANMTAAELAKSLDKAKRDLKQKEHQLATKCKQDQVAAQKKKKAAEQELAKLDKIFGNNSKPSTESKPAAKKTKGGEKGSATGTKRPKTAGEGNAKNNEPKAKVSKKTD